MNVNWNPDARASVKCNCGHTLYQDETHLVMCRVCMTEISPSAVTEALGIIWGNLPESAPQRARD